MAEDPSADRPDPDPDRRPRPRAVPTGGAAGDRLRSDIDAGRTGDKVDYPDPAAAPLGTDAEAAGTPTDAAAAERAHRREAARKDSPRTPLAADRPDDRPDDPARMQAEAARNRLLALLAVVVILGIAALAWGGG